MKDNLMIDVLIHFFAGVGAFGCVMLLVAWIIYKTDKAPDKDWFDQWPY